MLDWIFEGIITWISSIASSLMDAVSGLFLNALGADMTVMEEYFPFITVAYTVMQYMAWAILFLITVWQLFRTFGGPITELEHRASNRTQLYFCPAYRDMQDRYLCGIGHCACSIYSALGSQHDQRGFYFCGP